MGILAPQDLTGMDPSTQGMLAAGMSMLANSGPSRMPVSFGAIAGRAGLEGMGVYQQSLESLRKLSQTDALVALEKQKGDILKLQAEALARKEALINEFLKRYMGGGAGAATGPLAPPAAAGPSIMQGSGSSPAWMPPSAPSAPSAPSPLAPNAGAGGPMIANNAAAVEFAKLAGLGDFTEMHKFLNTPQTAAANTFSRDPATGAITHNPDPYKDVGYLQRVAQAEAQAKGGVEVANRPPVARQIPNLGTVMLGGPQDIAYANTGALPGSGATAPQQPAAAQPGSPEEAAAKFLRLSSQEQPQGEPIAPKTMPLLRPGQVQSDAEAAAEKVTAEGKARLELERPKAAAAVRDAFSNLDRMKKEAEELLKHPGLSRITGIMSKIPSAPGSDAANAQAKLETLTSQIAFAALQAMRDASKTGGALGSVSNFEDKMLQNNLAALDTKQSPAAFAASLRKVAAYAGGAKARMRRAYGETYGRDHAKEFQLTADEILGM